MHVFPLAPGSKIPMAGSHGHLDASNDTDLTLLRWQQHPTANIGLATGRRSGIWTVDVDRQHRGIETLAHLEAEHGALPLTIEASTPSGGRHHLYFKWPADGPEIRNSCSRVGPGLDVRGEGGSVVAPPSVLRDGRCYRWTANGARGFSAAPQWLIEASLPPPPPRAEPKPISHDVTKYVAAAVTAELAELDQARPGTRNDTLCRVAFTLARFVAAKALPEDWSAAELERRAVAIGLTVHEARATIYSAFAAGMREPRELPHG